MRRLVMIVLSIAFAAGTVSAGETAAKATPDSNPALTAEYDRTSRHVEWPSVTTSRGKVSAMSHCTRTSCDPFWHCYPSEFYCKQYNIALNCEDGIEIHGACFCQDC